LFEAAEKGTIFLDEIGDISPALQAKLLRVLQSKEVRPVGETRVQQIDVRVISATNRDLGQLVSEGKFREDLLYRLRVVNIAVPPLRERLDDILPLARYFLDEFRRCLRIQSLRLFPATVDVLMNYPWPGNVRELKNALEHAAVLCTDGLITPEILPAAVIGRAPLPALGNTAKSLKDLELERIRQVLEMTQGNRSKASRILGISEATLYRRLRNIKV
jgi:transcriptional regulator with PAS, ATPase and Fis domain